MGRNPSIYSPRTGIGYWCREGDFGFSPVAACKIIGGYILIYDKIGLGFRVFGEGDEGGGIRVIWVFRPGSAKTIWKF